MSREVKRVPLDFDYPMGEVWMGYLFGFLGREKSHDAEESFLKYLKQTGAEVPDDDLDEWVYSLRVEIPEGEGWQMWETTSEGSPMSPVFETPEELARWLTDNNASAFGHTTASYDEWLATIKQGHAISAVYSADKGFRSGVKASNEKA